MVTKNVGSIISPEILKRHSLDKKNPAYICHLRINLPNHLNKNKEWAGNGQHCNHRFFKFIKCDDVRCDVSRDDCGLPLAAR